jgi:hypothetical protein
MDAQDLPRVQPAFQFPHRRTQDVGLQAGVDQSVILVRLNTSDVGRRDPDPAFAA